MIYQPWSDSLVGHPSEPDLFEFSMRRESDGRVIRIRSFTVMDTAWPWWRRLAARIAARVLSS